MRILLSCLLFPLMFVPGVFAYSAVQDTLSLTLEECIRIAQNESPDAKIVESNFGMQHWQYRAFQASFLPQFGLTAEVPGLERAINPIIQDDGSIRYQSQSQAQSSVGLSLSQNIPLTGGRVAISSEINRVDLFGTGGNSEYLWRARPMVLGITQPVFQFNAQKWNREIETLRYEMRTKQYTEDKLDIAIDVTRQFFDLYIAKIDLEIARFNASINDTIYTISKGRYTVGNIAENDLLQSELALMNARTQFQSTLLEYEQAEADLKITLGIPVRKKIDILPPLEFPVIESDPEFAVDRAMANRSNIIAYRIQQKMAEQDVAQAKSNAGLSATLMANFGYNKTASEFSDLYTDPLDQQYVNMQFEFPVFQWGQGQARIEAAKAAQERARVEIQLSERRFKQEVKSQVREFQQLREQLRLDAKADTIAQRRFEVTKNRYLIGKVDITNMQIAQNERARARQKYFQTLRNYWTAYYRLQRLTGYDFRFNQPIRFAHPDTE